MITTGFDARVKVQQIVDNQLPEYILSEAPKASEFLKQYYISQEYQGGPIDISENLDQYLNLNNLTPDIVVGVTSLTSAISTTDDTITVESTKGYPSQYGLFKVDDEIVTYTGLTTNSFTGCIRGFSGITTYSDILNPEELVFTTSKASSHNNNAGVENLSALFLKEFYRRIKYLLAPGFEDVNFVENLDINKFVKQIRDFYQAKGTDEAFRILFNVLYGKEPKIINLEDYLLKPSDADFIRREVLVCEVISGNPNGLVGQVLKSSDDTASGPISEVEIVTRGGKVYYKIQLFAGFNDKSLIEGTFKISPKSKVGDTVSIGSSVITVDSTVGFSTSGVLICDGNNITYNDKNINQFFGCSGINSVILPSTNIRSNDTVYGYEDGDTSKKVTLRVTGVLSDIENENDFSLLLKDDTISVKNLGEKIENNNKSFKEFAFNTWLYNTSSRYEIESFNNNQLTLFETTDDSSLKVGDIVDVLGRNSENIIVSSAQVTAIFGKIVSINVSIPSNILSNADLSIRRKYKYANSTSNLPLSASSILSNVQNTYNEKDESMYVASNSLPDFPITKNIYSSSFTIPPNVNATTLDQLYPTSGYNIKTDRYSIISFPTDVPFITGDSVVYTGTVGAIENLIFGRVYYVEVLNGGGNSNKIRLYNSRSFIGTTNYIQFNRYSDASSHTFTLERHYNKELLPKKSLAKFPLEPNIKSGTNQPTPLGPIGRLINGVEIINYKTTDSIFYGPVDDVQIYNGGTDYDVINPPSIIVSDSTAGIGTTALVTSVVRGSVKEVQVDPQDFSINKLISATISGGNGEGAVLEAVVLPEYREIEFNAAPSDASGGVDVSEEQITFIKQHRLIDGDRIVYNPNGNEPLGIGDFGGSNTDQEEYLVSGSMYYAKVANTSSIFLYRKESDYISGINTVGFTTINTGGIHKFRLFEPKNTISEIRVLESGSGYENRKLIVEPSGISTFYNSVNYKSHGFKDGDLVDYSFGTTGISGLSTTNQYYIIKEDDDSFKLADASTIDGVYEDLKLKLSANELGRNITKFNDSPELVVNGEFSSNAGWTLGTGWAISGGKATHTGAGAGYLTSTPSTPFIEGRWYVLTADVSAGVMFNRNGGFGIVNHHDRGYTQGNGSDLVDVYTERVGDKLIALWKQNNQNLNNVNLYSSGGNNNSTIDNVSIKEVTTFGKSTTNYDIKNYVEFSTTGSGYQTFSYPPVEINIEAEFVGVGTGSVGIITATPIVRGELVDTYVYNKGTNYGSDVLNFHKKPTLTIKNGSGAELSPIISGGIIVGVQVQNGGTYYYAAPDLSIIGDGSGAKLRAVVDNGAITKVIVINGGIGYNSSNTSILPVSAGRNAVLDIDVRKLTINNYNRFGDEVYEEYGDGLSYGVVGYSTNREGTSFLDPNPDTGHSRVIGWAYDGNPIYGPYGYTDPKNNNSIIKKINTSYSASETNIVNRPPISDFGLGFFVEDYKFDGSGDLDIHNGRFTKTPEYPNGVYAYFVGVATDATANQLIPEFPYFIANNYRSKYVYTNLDQSFDFNNSSLVRNTFPYRVKQEHSGNDFIVESNEDYKQITIVEDASKGSVTGLKILNSGTDYKVGNTITFDDSDNTGGGAAAEVIEIEGKKIVEISTSTEEYENVVVVRENQNNLRVYTKIGGIGTYHTLLDNDRVEISGLSTHVDGLMGSHVIGVASDTAYLLNDIPANVGLVTDIYVTTIPPIVGSGSTIGIGTETFAVINKFDDNILRVRRSLVGSSHTSGDSPVVSYYSNSFTIPLETEDFDSTDDYLINFNANKSVGVGINTGVDSSIDYFIGISPKNISIESQSIYIPNHPFKDNQRVTLTKPSTANVIQVRATSDGSTFNLPASGNSQDVYIINKSKDFIGLTTASGITSTTNGFFFVNAGSDNDEYSLKTNYNQLTADVKRIKTKVAVSTSHNLKDTDKIGIDIDSNVNVGLGNTAPIVVRFDINTQRILLNPIDFTDNSVKSGNILGLGGHGLKTGDKVSYGGTVTGLSTDRTYFVYRVDDDNIKLGLTHSSVTANIPDIISFTANSGGDDNSISLINPQIPVVKNSNLVFDVSDASLQDHKFKFYYDRELNSEFVSSGSTSSFSVVQEQIIGISSGARFTITYDETLPTKLYYSFEKNGVAIQPDTTVPNYSEILYTNSLYNGEYNVYGIGTTDFYISLKDIPESLIYHQDNCDTLKYTTKSLSASGPLSKFNITSGGFNYDRIPRITGLGTGTGGSLGSSGIVIASSTNIGNLNNYRIINEGFEYSPDRTLRPQAEVNRHLTLEASEKITSVEVLSGGKNYLSLPNLIVVNAYTGKKVDSGLIQPKSTTATTNNSISSVQVIEQPKGLDAVDHRVYAVNNSNGVQVSQIKSYNNGIVELEITTPAVAGFITPPFKAGDKIFIEGLKKASTTDNLGNTTSPGNGFNSADNGYNFFRVTEYNNTNPATIKYDIGEFTTNAGNIEDDNGDLISQDTFTSIVKEDNYPTFKITRVASLFHLEEPISIGDVVTDLKVSVVNKGFIKVTGEHEIKKGDVLKGNLSGNSARINDILVLNNRFNVGYSSKKSFGWKNNIGRLNDDLQVLPDNDYYQNLSYTIKSSVEYQTLKDSINKLVHPVGMKNFADTDFISKGNVSIGVTQSLSPVLDFVSFRRVDTINNFDLVQDYNPAADSSRFIVFKNRRLTDYINCSTNRVLQIDDISNSFSSSEFNKRRYADAVEYPITDFYSKFLVQISDEDEISSQLNEVVILNDYDNTYTLNKGEVYTDKRLGTFSGEMGEVGNPVLRFTPDDPDNFSYNLKVYRESFSPSPFNIGIGYTGVGFTRLSSKTERVGPASGSGLLGFSTVTFEANVGEIDTFYANAHIINETTNRQNYFEVVGFYDGTNTHIAESYFDTGAYSVSSGYIGTFGADVSGGILTLTFNNGVENNVLVKTKTVGIGSTTSGIGTYRYKVQDQADGAERTARMESKFQTISGISTSAIILDYKNTLEFSSKSLIRVSVGNTVALHNLLVVSDQIRSSSQHSQFISVGTASTAGIGSFSTETSGEDVLVKFHPDPLFATSDIDIRTFNQVIYRDIDNFNVPSPFDYGTTIENISNAFYGSVNEFGKDVLSFDLNYKGIPIYEKTLNPNNASSLNTSTGIFTINDHFYETGEELIYTPDSTLIGVNATSVGIGTTITSGALFDGDIISGFSTITGIGVSTKILNNAMVYGDTLPPNTTITGIDTSYTYFEGNVVSGGSSVITGVGNTAVLTVGSGIHSAANSASLGTIYAIGINSITASTTINAGTGRSYYSTDTNWAATVSNVATASTFRASYTTGIATDICPSTVYAIRLSKDTFKLTGTSGGTVKNPGIGFTFTSVGTGNYHRLEMKKKLEKALITVDGVTQYPIAFTPLNFRFENNSSTIGAAVTFMGLSGISSIQPRDLLKIDNEFMRIDNVGLATSPSGPITGLGTFPTIEVTRGFVGTAATAHADGSSIRIYKGSFNIVRNKIWFTEAPDGRGTNDRLDSSALPTPKSSFNGRVYLRQDYTGNQIYDDISLGFNGIGRTFTVQKEGEDTSDMRAGNNLVFINDVFQTPDTSNNSGNNYSFTDPEDMEVSGIGSITFTGVTKPNSNDVIISEYDVNQNQIPRGGVVISIGSTGGLGYAPLVGAAVTASLSSTGAITSVGIGTSGSFGSGYTSNIGIGISDIAYVHKFVSAGVNSITDNTGSTHTATDALYTSDSGVLKLTIANHGLTTGNTIGIATNSLTFTCNRDNHETQHAYPRTSDPAHNATLAITATTTNTISVGVGSGGGAGIGATILATVGAQYPHRFVSAVAGAAYTGGDHTHAFVSAAADAIAVDAWSGTKLTPTGVGYTASTGDLILTFAANHNLTAGSNTIGIATNSLSMTCDRDNHSAQKTYPRTTDPVHGNSSLAIIWNTPRKLMVHVGVSTNVPYNISHADYNAGTGDLVLTSASHGIANGTIVGINTGSLSLSCSQDNYATSHAYPRTTDPAHGAAMGISSVTTNTFTVNVGKSQSGKGGRLTFNVKDGGSGYVNPRFDIDNPKYEDLAIMGVSRLGIGETSQTGIGLSMTLDLAPPVDAGQFLRGPIPTPKSNRHADAATLIRNNKTLISEIAVGRMLEKYTGNYPHTFVSATAGSINRVTPSGAALTPNHAFYTPSTGVLKLTFAAAHGMSNGHTVSIDVESLKFTCGLDNFQSEHSYPRTTDPMGVGNTRAVTVGTGTDFTINVGAAATRTTIIPQYNTNSSVTNQDCIDDVADVLEAVAHNTQFDGNDQTVDAANLYITGAHVAGEEQETIYAFQQAKDMAILALANQPIGVGSGAQYKHKFVTSDADALQTGGNYAHTFISAANNAVTRVGGASTTPSGATYVPSTGILTLTFANLHGIIVGNKVKIANHSLVFTCEGDNHATQHGYPRATDPASGQELDVLSATNSTPHQITVQVGVSTLVNQGITTATYNAESGDLVANVGSGHTILGPQTLNTPTAVTYAPSTGSLRLTIASHGCAVGDRIRIKDNSLTFTCALDQDGSQHSYPRSSDPASGEWLTVTQRTSNRIWVNVGSTGIASAHTFVSATANGIEKARTVLGISTESMTWTCDRDYHASSVLYPRTTDPFHNKLVAVASTEGDTITFNVGVSTAIYTGAKQVFDRTILGATSQQVGVYTATDCAKVQSAVSTLVGIVTYAVGQSALPEKTPSNPSLFEVSRFEITKPGYSFMRGDNFKPVGLVTARDIIGERYNHKFVTAATDAVFTGGQYNHNFISATAGAAFTGGNYSHTFVPRPENANCVSVDDWGSGTTLSPTVASYDANTGNLILTFAANHNLTAGSNTIGITTTTLAFTCSRDNHASVHEYPRLGDPIHGLANVAIGATTLKTLTVNVGVSTIVNNPVSIGTYTPATGELILDVGTNHGFTTAFTRSVTTCTYNPTNGVIDFESTAHGMSSGDYVQFPTDSLIFTCAKDLHATEHAYPRNTLNKDRLGKQWLPVDYVGVNTFQVNVGPANDSTVGVHTFVRADGQFRWANKTALIGIATESLVFTCDKDSHATQHSYPRTTDPVHGRQIGIGATGHTSISINVGISTLVKYTPSGSNYNPHNGDLVIITTHPHDIKAGNLVGIATNSLTFTCGKDGHVTNHTYPRTGDVHTFVSATSGAVSITGGGTTTPSGASYAPSTGLLTLTFANAHGITSTDTVSIGLESLTFTCDKDANATEHAYPRTTDPIYGKSLDVKLVPSTTSIIVDVGRSNTGDPSDNKQLGVSTASTYTFTVNVGASPVGAPRTPLKFSVEETFSDSFSSWQLGEFDFIDSIKSLQNGTRTRFPLYKNSQLLSFERDPADANASLIDFDTILLIYINGVMQEPKVAYEFTGGTTFTFTHPPLKDDKIDIFFYRGTAGSDSLETNITEILKIGDDLQINKNDGISDTVGQDTRILSRIISSDQVETGIYLGDGIDAVNYKPVDWVKQKRDLLINDNPHHKTRDSLEGMVFPTAKIIGNVSSSDKQIFVDDAQFFNYEENESTTIIPDVDAIMVPTGDPVAAALTANVSASSTISSVNVIGDGGSGYTPGSITLKVSQPPLGVGTFFKSAYVGVGTLGIGSDVITGIVTDGIKLGQTIEPITNVIGSGVTITGISTDHLLGNVVSISANASNSSILIRQFNLGKFEVHTQATATATVSAAGTITNPVIVKSGSGYTSTNPPAILAPVSATSSEKIFDIRFVQGFSGIVTGITTSAGINHPMGLTFFLKYQGTDVIDDLVVNTPIVISNTHVGHGVTSVDGGGNTTIVGIGTTFADNVYKIHAIQRDGLTGIITCNVDTGITTTGIPDNVNDISGISTIVSGKFSWGKLSGLTRNESPIGIAVTGYTVNSGLTTFPTIQRRGYGLRDKGALKKDLDT